MHHGLRGMDAPALCLSLYVQMYLSVYLSPCTSLCLIGKGVSERPATFELPSLNCITSA